MKALDIFYDEIEILNTKLRILPCGHWYESPIIEKRKIINEAIAELESLQNRSCNGCKWYCIPDDDFPYCIKHERNSTFMCDRLNLNDRYEPKDKE